MHQKDGGEDGCQDQIEGDHNSGYGDGHFLPGHHVCVSVAGTDQLHGDPFEDSRVCES